MVSTAIILITGCYESTEVGHLTQHRRVWCLWVGRCSWCCGWPSLSSFLLGRALVWWFPLLLPGGARKWMLTSLTSSPSITVLLCSFSMIVLDEGMWHPQKENAKVILQMGLRTGFSPDRRNCARRNLSSGFDHSCVTTWAFPGGASGKEPAWQRRCWFDLWVGKIPWRRAWQPTPVFLPGESHEQRSLVGYSP